MRTLSRIRLSSSFFSAPRCSFSEAYMRSTLSRNSVMLSLNGLSSMSSDSRLVRRNSRDCSPNISPARLRNCAVIVLSNSSRSRRDVCSLSRSAASSLSTLTRAMRSSATSPRRRSAAARSAARASSAAERSPTRAASVRHSTTANTPATAVNAAIAIVYPISMSVVRCGDMPHRLQR